MLCVGCRFSVTGISPSSMGQTDFASDLHAADFAVDLAGSDGQDRADLLRSDAHSALDMTQKPPDMTRVTGVLTGSIGYPLPSLDLNSEGSSDWLTIGYMSQYDIEHKASGNSQISASSSDDLALFSGFYMQMNWEDGTPTMTVSGDDRGVMPAHNAQMFTFTVPADTTQRTLKIYLGSSGNCTFKAHLSDSSATDFAPTAFSAPDEMVETLTYSAATSGQSLEVTWAGGTNAYPLFEAATLAISH